MCKEPRKSGRLECMVMPRLVRIVDGSERMKGGEKGGKVFWGGWGGGNCVRRRRVSEDRWTVLPG